MAKLGRLLLKVPRWLAVLLTIAVVIGGGLWWITRPPPTLTVVSWGAEYGRAQTLAMFHPFEDKNHIDVMVDSYGGGLKEIAGQVASGDVQWDVVDLELADAAEACRRGLLENLIDEPLPPGIDGVAAARDFVPEAVGPCWIGSAVYAQVIGYDTAHFGAAPPKTVADFFDLQHYPGPRGMRDNGPKYNLEMALLADGVPPWQVYATLATPRGVARAFAKLDSIKSSIVWYRSVAEPAELLMTGKVVMSTILNAHSFSSEAAPPIATLWDGQMYQLDVFGIPRGDPNRKRAMDFIRFATGAMQLARLSSLLPLGPARHSALRLVTRNPETNVDMRPQLPTAPENFTHALAIDPDWWDRHGSDMAARWTAWRQASPAH